MNTWAEWFEEVTEGQTLRQVSSQTAYSKSSFSKWGATGNPPADAVIAVAKAYDADLIAGLIAAGSIEPGDLGSPEILRHIPTDFLVNELHRRWRDGEITHPMGSSS